MKNMEVNYKENKMKSLLLDFLDVTESAAIAAVPWIGSGDKMSADAAGTAAMRSTLNQMEMDGTIVIGEGEIDKAPMLYIGEKVGFGHGQGVDIAVDPIEGTTPTVNGQNNAIAVIAAAPKGTLLHAPDMYMQKLAVGPKVKGNVSLNASIADNLQAIAEAKGKQIHNLTVAIQDRPRHEKYIREIRAVGAKAHLFKDGDVIYATATCLEYTGIDMFMGIGGAPEGVIAAVALKALGGEMQARLKPRHNEERKRCVEMGLMNPQQILAHNQLVQSDDCIFSATGITDNILLKGMGYKQNHYVTNSIVIGGRDKRLHMIDTQHFDIEVN